MSVEFDHFNAFRVFVPRLLLPRFRQDSVLELHVHDLVSALLKLILLLSRALVEVDAGELSLYFVPFSIGDHLYLILDFGELAGTFCHQKFILRQACLS